MKPRAIAILDAMVLGSGLWATAMAVVLPAFVASLVALGTAKVVVTVARRCR